MSYFSGRLNQGLAAAVVLTAAVLVVGTRLDTVWAGGSGASEAAVVVTRLAGSPEVERAGVRRPLASGDRLRRGEIIRTDADERIEFTVDAHRVALDERTDLTLTDLAPTDTRLHFTRGRLRATFADTTPAGARLTFETNATDTLVLGGQVSLVNYDWLETVSVIPLDTAVTTITNGHAWLLRSPVDIHETDPVTITDITFDATTSAAAEFYAWVRVLPPPEIAE